MAIKLSTSPEPPPTSHLGHLRVPHHLASVDQWVSHHPDPWLPVPTWASHHLAVEIYKMLDTVQPITTQVKDSLLLINLVAGIISAKTIF